MLSLVLQFSVLFEIPWGSNTKLNIANIFQMLAKTSMDAELGGLDWMVQPYQFNLKDSNVFFLAVTPTANSTGGFESHYFNITQPVVTSSLATVTHSPTSSNPLISNATVTAATTTAPISSIGNSFRQYQGLGLGLGLGLGIPLILVIGVAVACAVVLKRNSKNKRSQPKTRISLLSESKSHQQDEIFEAPSLSRPHEVSAENPVCEAALYSPN